MKHLVLFEGFSENLIDLRNSISANLNSIGFVSNPTSWGQVENNSIDFEDLDEYQLKAIMKLPIYKVEDLFYNPEPPFLWDHFKQGVSMTIPSYFILHIKWKEKNFEMDKGLIINTEGFSYLKNIKQIDYFSEFYDYYKKQSEIDIKEYYLYVDNLLISINEEKLDVKSYWNKVQKKVKFLPGKKKRKILLYAFVLLLSMVPYNQIRNSVEDDPTALELLEISRKFKKPSELRLSQEGRDRIREFEGFRLTAYKLGDKMITMGYGHAEPIKTSKFKKGDRITKQQANKFFQEDVQAAADGVRRIFRDWEKEGIKRKVTQDQFDILVDLAYNMGVTGLRRTQFMEDIKNGDYEQAGETLKTTGIHKKYKSALSARREKESDVFMSYLD